MLCGPMRWGAWSVWLPFDLLRRNLVLRLRGLLLSALRRGSRMQRAAATKPRSGGASSFAEHRPTSSGGRHHRCCLRHSALRILRRR